MLETDEKLILLIGGSCLFCLIYGIHGLVKDSSDKNKSSLYISVNALIWGVMMIPAVIFFYFTRISSDFAFKISTNLAYTIIMAWFGWSSLVCGIHGIIYKKVINNKIFDSINNTSIFTFFVLLIGGLAYIAMWGFPKY